VILATPIPAAQVEFHRIQRHAADLAVIIQSLEQTHARLDADCLAAEVLAEKLAKLRNAAELIESLCLSDFEVAEAL
jgi:hypothetical protein